MEAARILSIVLRLILSRALLVEATRPLIAFAQLTFPIVNPFVGYINPAALRLNFLLHIFDCSTSSFSFQPAIVGRKRCNETSKYQG